MIECPANYRNLIKRPRNPIQDREAEEDYLWPSTSCLYGFISSFIFFADPSPVYPQGRGGNFPLPFGHTLPGDVSSQGGGRRSSSFFPLSSPPPPLCSKVSFLDGCHGRDVSWLAASCLFCFAYESDLNDLRTDLKWWNGGGETGKMCRLYTHPPALARPTLQKLSKLSNSAPSPSSSSSSNLSPTLEWHNEKVASCYLSSTLAIHCCTSPTTLLLRPLHSAALRKNFWGEKRRETFTLPTPLPPLFPSKVVPAPLPTKHSLGQNFSMGEIWSAADSLIKVFLSSPPPLPFLIKLRDRLVELYISCRAARSGSRLKYG